MAGVPEVSELRLLASKDPDTTADDDEDNDG